MLEICVWYILRAWVGVIAATLSSFATPAADFRVERRGAIVTGSQLSECGVKVSSKCAALKGTTCVRNERTTRREEQLSRYSDFHAEK
jgi:hypothetical protein